jgi:protein involved in sex pheromone biosynthesis
MTVEKQVFTPRMAEDFFAPPEGENVASESSTRMRRTRRYRDIPTIFEQTRKEAAAPGRHAYTLA